MPQVKPLKLKIKTAKKPKQAATPKNNNSSSISVRSAAKPGRLPSIAPRAPVGRAKHHTRKRTTDTADGFSA